MESTTNEYAIRYIFTFFPSYILCGFILRRHQYLKSFSVGSTQVGINRRGFGEKRSPSLPNPSTISGFASGIYVNHENHVGIHDILPIFEPGTCQIHVYTATPTQSCTNLSCNDRNPTTAETIKQQKAMYRHLITNT